MGGSRRRPAPGRVPGKEGRMRRHWVGAAWAAASVLLWCGAPAAGQTTPTPLPCNMVCDRTVQPLDILVNEKVQVNLGCTANCEQARRPLDVFFVVDRTMTMFGKRYMDPTKAALIEFVNKMDLRTEAAGLITFARNDQVVTNLTHDRNALLSGINAIRMSEEEDVRGLPAAFRTATGKLDNDGTPGNHRVVIIIEAGPDQNQANINMPTVTQAARNAGVSVVFLMFPGTAYTHYVDAASDCSSPLCPRWSAPGGQPKQKMAWNVDGASIGSMLNSTVREVVTATGQAIRQVRIREAMHSCAAFDPTSAVPPPTNPVAPPYVAMDWIFPGTSPLLFQVQYEAQLVCGDDSYPVTSMTVAVIDMDDGRQISHNLPNPLVRVRGPAAPTETATATAQASATASEAPTELATTTATPTEEPTTPSPSTALYLPALLQSYAYTR